MLERVIATSTCLSLTDDSGDVCKTMISGVQTNYDVFSYFFDRILDETHFFKYSPFVF